MSRCTSIQDAEILGMAEQKGLVCVPPLPVQPVHCTWLPSGAVRSSSACAGGVALGTCGLCKVAAALQEGEGRLG